MKYDLKAQGKSLLPVYLLAFGMAVAVRIMSMVVPHVPILGSIYTFMIVISVFSLIGVAIWTAIVSVKHFYTNMLQDEGYLTNTLPVTRNQLILSKEIISIVTMFIAVIVIVVSAMVGFYQGGIKDFFTMISDFMSLQGVNGAEFLVWIVVTMVISYIAFVQMCFTSLLCGQTKNNNKIVFAIVFGIVIYMIRQIFSAASLFVVNLISPDVMSNAINGDFLSMSEVYDYAILIFVISIVITIVTMLAMHCVSVYLANKKLNLE